MAFDLQELWTNNRCELSEFRTLKDTLKCSVKKYKELVVTEDAIASAKLDRASLNNKKKAINELKKNVVNNATALFVEQCKELMGIIDEAVENIDTQVKNYEEGFKNKKKEDIENLYASKEKSSFISLEKIWNPKWLNATYLMSTIEQEIDIALEKYVLDLDTLKSMCLNDTEWALGLDVLNKTLDLTKALAEVTRVRNVAPKSTPTPVINTEGKTYELGFIVEATLEQVEALNTFLSETKIRFTQLSKEQVKAIRGE